MLGLFARRSMVLALPSFGLGLLVLLDRDHVRVPIAFMVWAI